MGWLDDLQRTGQNVVTGIAESLGSAVQTKVNNALGGNTATRSDTSIPTRDGAALAATGDLKGFLASPSGLGTLSVGALAMLGIGAYLLLRK